MIIYQKFIHRSDLKKNPKILYLFGDNDQRKGFGGQAKECRGEPNAVGIRTKKRPGLEPYDFYSDEELAKNIAKIDEDFERVIQYLRREGVVVIPSDGLGTGKANMADRCPRTFEYLNRKLDNITNI